MPAGELPPWLIVFVHAVLPKDWHALAGTAFRTTLQALREFAEKNKLLPKDLMVRGFEAIFGKFKSRDPHESPDTKEKIRTVETWKADEDRRIAEARADEAEARAEQAKIEAATAGVKFLKELAEVPRPLPELLKRPEGAGLRKFLKSLNDANVLLDWDEMNNNLKVLPKPKDSPSLLRPDSEGEASPSKETA